MWDLWFNFGGVVAIAILLAGGALSLVLLHKFVGEEASVIIGLLLAAYPAYLAFQKL